MLDFYHINKSFNSNQALQDINLHIPAKKVTAMIGPSGCGKSTLLRLILGLNQADSGEIHWQGEVLNSDRIQLLRQQTGDVIQDGGLFPHMTVRENISVMAKHIGWSSDEINKKIIELCNLTSLSETLLPRYPAEISGGQRQRVSLMRALMLNPDILLLDEPLGALDPLIRFDMQKELKNIFHTLNKTVIMVTHDLAEADFFADEIILLKNGHIVQKGLINDFINTPKSAFVTRFVKAQRSLIVD